MVIRQTLPFDLAPRSRRAPARTTLIVTVSLGVHAAVAAYLAMMQFAPPQAPSVVDDPPIRVDILPREQPPPPPEPDPKPQPRPIQFNEILPPTAPTPPVAPLQVDRPPEPVKAIGPLATLTTGPVAPTAPPDPVIHNPTWLKRPGATEFARFYPDREIRREIEGKAVLTCFVTATGSVTNCRVASLTPAGSGFGEAALKLSRYFVMSPRTVDGRPVEGGQVTIPIAFNLN